MKLLPFALLLPCLASATGTFVHSATATTAGFCSTPLQATLSVTAGNLLIVGIGSYAGFSSAPTDGVNTYSLAVHDQASNATAAIYYATAATTASVTVSISSCGQWSNLIFAEYSGFSNTVSQTGVAISSGSATTQTISSPPGGLVVSVVYDQTAGGYTLLCSGLSVRAQADGGGPNSNFGLADALNASGSYSATWSGWVTSLGIQTVIASFGAGSSGILPRKTVRM